MERRPLAAGIQSIPNADPAAVRQFVMQDRTAPPVTASADQENLAARGMATDTALAPLVPRRPPAAIVPIGLIPVTVRLRPELAGALKRASLERQLAGEVVFTQQQLVEQALEPWLRSLGYLA